MGRWVDDFFFVEPQESIEHAKNCAARILRAVLGADAVAVEKLQHGNPLTALGLSITFSPGYAKIVVSRDKATKWACHLDKCLNKGRMSSGEVSKFSGRFNFATQNAFVRFGRALIRPFYEQQYAPLRSSRMGDLLSAASKWWQEA